MEANPNFNLTWRDIWKFTSDSNLLLFLNQELYRFLSEFPDDLERITVADIDEAYERICVARGFTEEYVENWHAISECCLGQDWANEAREFCELIQKMRENMDRSYETIVRIKQMVAVADEDDDDFDGISDEEYSEEGGIGMSSDEEEDCERLRPPGH